MVHTVTYSLDGVQTGQIYSFRFKARNSIGYSEYSQILSVAATSPPTKAATPQVDYTLSDRMSLHLKWDLNSDGPGGIGTAISGYKLYMDDGRGGLFSAIFDSVGKNA
jgi:hypothetical protein